MSGSRRVLVAALALAGCGRLGFDALSDGGGGGDTANDQGLPNDATAFEFCGTQASVPASVPLSGVTRALVPFTSAADQPNATLSIRRGLQANVIGGGTSDGNGQFMVGLATGGTAQSFTVQISTAGFFTTIARLGFPLGVGMPPIVAPIVRDTDIDAMYATAGQVPDSGRGTVIVQVADCTNQLLPNVTITTNPVVGAIRYVDATTGQATATAATSARGLAVLFNVPVGNVDLMLTAPGHTFAVRTTQVGSLNNIGLDVVFADP